MMMNETPNDSEERDIMGMDDKLNAILTQVKANETKIDEVQKDVGQKWRLPVFLAILGFFLGITNFLIQQQVTNANIAENEIKKITTQYVINQKIQFLSKCKSQIVRIDEELESYYLSQDLEVRIQLDSLLIDFRRLIREHDVVDQSAFDLEYEELTEEGRKALLSTCKTKFEEINQKLELAIKTLTK